jgi:hypothetical protein
LRRNGVVTQPVEIFALANRAFNNDALKAAAKATLEKALEDVDPTQMHVFSDRSCTEQCRPELAVCGGTPEAPLCIDVTGLCIFTAHVTDSLLSTRMFQ